MTCHFERASNQTIKHQKALQQSTVIDEHWRDFFLSVLLSTTLSFLVIHAEKGEYHE